MEPAGGRFCGARGLYHPGPERMQSLVGEVIDACGHVLELVREVADPVVKGALGAPAELLPQTRDPLSPGARWAALPFRPPGLALFSPGAILSLPVGATPGLRRVRRRERRVGIVRAGEWRRVRRPAPAGGFVSHQLRRIVRREEGRPATRWPCPSPGRHRPQHLKGCNAHALGLPANLLVSGPRATLAAACSTWNSAIRGGY